MKKFKIKNKKTKKIKLGIVDTTFSRVNMGEIVLDELKKNYRNIVKVVRSTVPGIKDLPVECKLLLKKEKCDVVIALGMVGSAPIDGQCAHESSLGIQIAKLLTDKPIIEVFVHENEAWCNREFFEICNNRIRKHTHNAVNIIINKNKLIENAGKGIRQGKEDEEPIKDVYVEEEVCIGIVISEFNQEITERMGKSAIDYAVKNSIKIAKIVGVPGAYDTPIATKKLLMNKKISGVVVLGAIVKGGTDHDNVIANATAKTLQELSVEFKKPVTFGIIGPGATIEQAEERAKGYAERAVNGVIKIIRGVIE